MMGGMGSGGWNASGRATTNLVPRLDADRLRKSGGLHAGRRALYSWSNGATRADIVCTGEQIRVTITRTSDGDRQSRSQIVDLERRPCRLGGERAFFLCPYCQTPRVHLYLGAHQIACRECFKLTYVTRRMRERDRLLHAANRHRRALGGPQGAWNGLPDRPRWMKQATFRRHFGVILEREALAMDHLAAFLARFKRSAVRVTSTRPRTRSRSLWS